MLNNFSIEKTTFKDLLILSQHRHDDSRGCFVKLYSSNFIIKKKKINLKQVNFSLNKKKGTMRGMHYQIGKFAEEKIVTCVKGKIYDVVVDLRVKSKTYLKWFKIILTPKGKKSLFVPKGFAHGFQTLEDNSEIIYVHSSIHKKKYERTINLFDPKINIKWPIKEYKISQKDKDQNLINNNFRGMNV